MLSDNALEKLIQPFIDRQENLNNYVISIIAKRIKEIGQLTHSDIFALGRLLKSGADVRLINAEIAKLTNLQVKEVKSLIKNVASDAYLGTKPFYDYRHKSFIPFEKNKALQTRVEAISRQTEQTFKNLSNSGAFMHRAKKTGKLIPSSISETYQRIIDEAIQWTQQGGVDYQTAMRKAIDELTDSGIREVWYESKSGRIHSQRLDTAVRRNLLDGVRQINQAVQDIAGEQFDADGKEISVHEMSAPDHEPVQGLQFTNEEFDKLQNGEPFESYAILDHKKQYFEAVDRPIGWWNCRHFTTSIILGVMKPMYSFKKLQEFKQKNKAGYTLPNGRHLTMYQCTQFQRDYELRIKQAKEKYLAFEDTNDKEMMNKYKARVTQLIREYNQFSKDCGLASKSDRYYVKGY